MKKLEHLVLLTAIVILISGCQSEAVIKQSIPIIGFEAKDEPCKLENDQFLFELDQETSYFTVTDKKSGYVWYSNPEDAANDPTADALSLKYLQSTLLLEYASDNGIYSTYDNYEMSIAKKTYQVHREDDQIEVTYVVGDTQREYRYPIAIPASRMDPYLERMDKSQQRQIENYYRKYQIDKLRSSDDKGELLALYPNLKDEAIYVFRDGLQEYIKEKVEQVFTDIDYTDEEFEYDKSIYSVEKVDDIPVFQVSIIYSLDEDGLAVELPFEKMLWKNTYPLTKIHVLPYLAAGDTEEEGYVMVPEGTGAVIEFNNGKNEQSAYYTNIFGWDEGIKREQNVAENKAIFPAFGIGREEGSMLCVMEDYATLGSIKADVSGRSHSYNYGYASYITLHSDAMDVSAKTDKSVMVYEDKKPEGSIRQKYIFLRTTDYSDMASVYGDYLAKKYPNLNRELESGTPINIDLLGAVDDLKQFLGIPKLSPLALTDFQEAKALVEALSQEGFESLSIRYQGWMNGGENQRYDKGFPLVKELGSRSDLDAFIRTSQELGTQLYMDGYTQYAYNHKLSDDLKVSRDVSKYASREIVELKPFSFVSFGTYKKDDVHYLLKPEVSIAYLKALAGKVEKREGTGIGLLDTGKVLSGDYNPSALTTREAVSAIHQEALKEIRDKDMKVAIDGGNSYLLNDVDLITDMNLEGEDFNIIDYKVPFYTMAIHDKVTYTGYALNGAQDFNQQLLKSVENGAGLNFTLMKASADILQDTDYTKYFGADYERWNEKIKSIYERYNTSLGHTFGQKMVRHERVADRVFAVTYEDGTQVYVNYDISDYAMGNTVVGARDYLVMEGAGDND